MTVKELITKLQSMDQDDLVSIRTHKGNIKRIEEVKNTQCSQRIVVICTG
jgi:hypothetical protein